MKLTWKDHEEIAWALIDKFPDQDPLRLSFPKLHAPMGVPLPVQGSKVRTGSFTTLRSVMSRVFCHVGS